MACGVFIRETVEDYLVFFVFFCLQVYIITRVCGVNEEGAKVEQWVVARITATSTTASKRGGLGTNAIASASASANANANANATTNPNANTKKQFPLPLPLRQNDRFNSPP